MKIKQQSKRSSAVGIAASLLTVGLWLATSSLPAFAADFSVNETFDAMDKTPGDGVCEVTNNGGDCTLRAAVMDSQRPARRGFYYRTCRDLRVNSHRGTVNLT